MTFSVLHALITRKQCLLTSEASVKAFPYDLYLTVSHRILNKLTCP